MTAALLEGGLSYRGYLIEGGMPSRLTGDIGIFWKGKLVTTARDLKVAYKIIDDWMDAP